MLLVIPLPIYRIKEVQFNGIPDMMYRTVIQQHRHVPALSGHLSVKVNWPLPKNSGRRSCFPVGSVCYQDPISFEAAGVLAIAYDKRNVLVTSVHDEKVLLAPRTVLTFESQRTPW